MLSSGKGWSSVVLDGPARPIEVQSIGTEPAVVAVPSMGRGAMDFHQSGQSLAIEGYQIVAPEPRGVEVVQAHSRACLWATWQKTPQQLSKLLELAQQH
ncbi:MAG: hypothetical protein P8M16_07840 [Acidimicrobiales bacterium]|nr:hypothetical protein [Acidimicrobiales bacterium]